VYGSRRGLMCLWLASVLLLIALGKIEAIILLFLRYAVVQVHCWVRSSLAGTPRANWNVESHQNPRLTSPLSLRQVPPHHQRMRRIDLGSSLV
jgi:hypothetical protein